MKFTASQLEFLMTKLTVADIEEAAVFKPTKKVVALEDKCFKLKKDGSQCSRRAKVDGLCSAHDTTKLLVKNVVPDEERCVALKKNGDRCISKMKVGDLCTRHHKLVEGSSSDLSEEVVVDSGSGSGSGSEEVVVVASKKEALKKAKAEMKKVMLGLKTE
jgi:Family of unknown function (DUF5763)